MDEEVDGFCLGFNYIDLFKLIANWRKQIKQKYCFFKCIIIIFPVGCFYFIFNFVGLLVGHKKLIKG